MKPIIFNVDKVFEDFDQKGEIATFRKSYPDDFKFWVRRSRTGEKEFEAVISRVVRASQANLSPFAEAQQTTYTGFGTDKEWRDKICEMYDGFVPSGWILYLEKIK